MLAHLKISIKCRQLPKHFHEVSTISTSRLPNIPDKVLSTPHNSLPLGAAASLLTSGCTQILSPHFLAFILDSLTTCPLKYHLWRKKICAFPLSKVFFPGKTPPHQHLELHPVKDRALDWRAQLFWGGSSRSRTGARWKQFRELCARKQSKWDQRWGSGGNL